MNDDEKGRPEPVLRLPVRYYQIARLYGPGIAVLLSTGLKEELHLWSLKVDME